jgi:hypothetical protein
LPQDSLVAFRDISDWVTVNLCRPGALVEMARIAAEAHEDRPLTGIRIADFASLAELERWASGQRDGLPEERVKRPVRVHVKAHWSGDWTLQYVRRHVASCRKFATFYGRGLVSMEDVHVRSVTGKWPDGAVKPDARPALVAALASTIAAPWNGGAIRLGVAGGRPR